MATPAFGAEEPAALEEVVVTARKREENLQDIPVAITAFSASALEAQGAASVADLTRATPNVSLSGQSAGNFNPNIIIRGISSSARNIGFESSLGAYMDGVFLGRTSGFDQDLNDVERVEVLRGPQGTLFGKNTISGAINIVTADPTNAFRAKLSAEVGDFDLRRADVLISGPLVADVLLGKLSIYGSTQEGYVENLNSAGTGPSALGDRDSWNLRGALKWLADEDFSLTARADYGQTKGTIYETEVAEGFGFVPGFRTVDVNRPSKDDRTSAGASLTGVLALTDSLELTSVTAYRSLDYTVEGTDLDSSGSDLLYADIADELKQYSQEFRLASDAGGDFTYVAGLYLFRQDARSERGFLFGADAGFPGGVRVSSKVETTSAAVFANGDYRLTNQLSLNAGLRYTHEKKTLGYQQSGGAPLGYPDVSLADDLSDSDVSVTAALNYEPTDKALLYLKYSTGFKSGGWNADITGTGGPPFGVDDLRFDSEKVASYEAGYKVTTFGRRLRLNIAAYYLSYEDIQVSQFVGGLVGFRTTNAGKAHSQGVEIEATARVLDDLEVSAGFGVSDARYDEYDNGAGLDLSGTRLDAPKYTGRLAFDYERPIGEGELFAGLAYTFQSSFPTDPLDLASGTDARDLVDVRVGYQLASGVKVTVWAKNLLDQDYEQSRGTQTNLELFGLQQLGVSYGAPRTLGLRLNYEF